ncbi:MAG: alpha/beta hydrolase [Cyanobacteria bacterium P01_D01_bin.71]
MSIQKTSLFTGIVGFTAGLLSHLGGALAADMVVLTYGPLAVDVPMDDLETFAESGETSDELGNLLEMAGQEPAQVRNTLNEPVPVNLTVLDLALNSPPGEWMLDRASETIQPASGEAGRLALRSALIGAASVDNEITLLEVMQAYPSPEIVVRGDRLVETYNLLNDILEPLEDLATIFSEQLRPNLLPIN